MSETRVAEVSALFLKDAQEFIARCKDEGLTMAIVAVEVPSHELAAAKSDLARLAQSNAELREDAERYRHLKAKSRHHSPHMDGTWHWSLPLLGRAGSLDEAVDTARRALSNEGE